MKESKPSLQPESEKTNVAFISFNFNIIAMIVIRVLI